ncbi:MAG TPA: ATP-binding protein [Kosmotogaceae bacterium]|nr:ATP-binding protein [Kosmotogaceae bacterium]
MLLDPKPKSKADDLFGREQELEALKRSLTINPITLITGMRRIGKSSLMKVALSEIEYVSVQIDVRRVYSDSSGSIGKMDLAAALEKQLTKRSVAKKLRGLLEKVKGISVMGNSISFDWRKATFSDILDKIDSSGEPFVLAIDEAQYFRYYGNRGGKSIQNLIAWSYDNLENIRFLLTGSEIGFLYDFLGFNDYDNPLHGRYMNEIRLRPFTKEEALRFLDSALRESGMNVLRKELEAAQDLLDGIVGHLIQYGLHRTGKDHDEALKEALRTAKLTLRRELAELKKRSPRYLLALQFIALGATKFSSVLKAFQASGDSVSKSRVSDALTVLQKMGWIEKKGSEYSLVDIVFERIFREE